MKSAKDFANEHWLLSDMDDFVRDSIIPMMKEYGRQCCEQLKAEITKPKNHDAYFYSSDYAPDGYYYTKETILETEIKTP